MSTDRELVQALVNAAMALVKRPLSQEETDQLVDLFNKATGKNQERAQNALQAFCKVTKVQLLEKTAASDNTDRLMRELESVAQAWKPGT